MEIIPMLAALARSKTGPLLVAAQVALTLAVLVNVAYVIHQRLQDANRPTGLDLTNTFWMSVQASEPGYDFMAGTKADLEYLNHLPGVRAAAVISTVPQTWSSSDLPFSADPKVLERPGGGEDAVMYTGSGRLIDALGLTLTAGRDFSPEAVQQPEGEMIAGIARWAPEIIITQALARKLFPPDGRALGKTIYAGLINKPAVVVGIVKLMRSNPVSAEYDSWASKVVLVPIIPPGGTFPLDFIVRAQPGQRDAVMAKVDKEFADLRPGRFVDRMEAMEVSAASAREGYRASIVILSVAAVCVLLVTVLGIVGLAAYNVASRTKQLGTRRAIGARRFHILRYFLVENWITSTAGVVVGVALAIGIGVILSQQLVLPRLPLYYLAGGVLLMWAVGLLAVLFPAMRAASIPPATATRTV